MITTYRFPYGVRVFTDDSQNPPERMDTGTDGSANRIAWMNAGWDRNLNNVPGHVEHCEPCKHQQPLNRSLTGHFGYAIRIQF
jgi:hypothetical protein